MRRHKVNLGNLTQSGFWVEILFERSQPWIRYGWSDPNHWSFRFPYDSLRGAHRAKGGSFLHLFTWRVWRGARGWEWKHWERRAWAPSFMEGARRLRAYLFCGEGSCLVEGASLAGTSSYWAFADLIGGGLGQHKNRDLHARVSQTIKRRSRVHQFSGRGNKGRGMHLFELILLGTF